MAARSRKRTLIAPEADNNYGGCGDHSAKRIKPCRMPAAVYARE
jgi:hypothetical protein